MRHRLLMLATVSTITLMAGAAAAQEPAPAGETSVEELVVTGTRTTGRSRLETLAPVDVLNAEQLSRQGNGAELGQALANLIQPAFDLRVVHHFHLALNLRGKLLANLQFLIAAQRRLLYLNIYLAWRLLGKR